MIHRSAALLLLTLGSCSIVAAAHATSCEMSGYKPVEGLKASATVNGVLLLWQGEGRQDLRAAFGLRNGQPVVTELAARKPGGQWLELGKDLEPEFQVTTGKRRMSKTEDDILKRLHAETPENEERYKWNVFWDAPLAVPGHDKSHLLGPGRSADEIRRATVAYNSSTCKASTDGARNASYSG